jgi:hypothetical protein
MHIDMAKARSAGIDRINSSFHATFKVIPLPRRWNRLGSHSRAIPTDWVSLQLGDKAFMKSDTEFGINIYPGIRSRCGLVPVASAYGSVAARVGSVRGVGLLKVFLPLFFEEDL